MLYGSHMTTEHRTAAEAILAAMNEADRTQRWTSDRAGISYPTFRRKLAGGGDFTVSEVSRIARVLHCQPSKLLPEEFQAIAGAA